MTNKQPQQPPTQISQLLTQAVQQLGKVNFSSLKLKAGAKVPELRVDDPESGQQETYPLLGDRYIIGRSSRSCDITIRNPLVSQIHCSLHRNRRHSQSFLLKDEGSTNGTYLGKRRLKEIPLRHGDTIAIGPPELANAVKLTYYNPPPLWQRWAQYSLYGAGGVAGLLLLLVGWQWSQVSVRPLPANQGGPIAVYAGDGQTPLSPIEKEVHRELPHLSDFSPYLPKAAIASEDSRYYWHFGVDPWGLLRAIAINFQAGGVRQGASTLTQQVARSLFPQVGREDTAGRKLREMAVALKLEAFYSKDELQIGRAYV